jgi:Putative peptidoglycan binding domain
VSGADLRGDGKAAAAADGAEPAGRHPAWPADREPDADVRTGAEPVGRHPAWPAAPEPDGDGNGVRAPGATTTISLSHPARGRRRALVAGGVVVAAAVGAGALVWRGGDSGSGATAEEPLPTATAEVSVRDLEERTELDGTLGYGDTRQLALSTQGTITWLPDEGAVVGQGQAVAEVDDRVVPLLFGDRPLWRELGAGVEDGVDVEAIERNLVALGVVTTAELTVDQAWTAATTDAVQEWQEALGLDDTGRIRPGDVAVQPAAVRVSAHLADVGGQPGGPVLEVAGTSRQVTVDLEATQQSLVAADQAVDIELPDGSTTTGRITTVGRVAETPAGAADDPGADTTPTIEVTIALDDPAAAGALDQAPVTVSVVTSAAEGVTAVPVDALLALSEGGYAVERTGAGGTTDLVAVEVGAFADGWVQVTGDLAEGDDVVVPA